MAERPPNAGRRTFQERQCLGSVHRAARWAISSWAGRYNATASVPYPSNRVAVMRHPPQSGGCRFAGWRRSAANTRSGCQVANSQVCEEALLLMPARPSICTRPLRLFPKCRCRPLVGFVGEDRAAGERVRSGAIAVTVESPMRNGSARAAAGDRRRRQRCHGRSLDIHQ